MSQTVALGGAHFGQGFGRRIVVADQVQCAVHNIKKKLVFASPAEFEGSPCRGLGTGDDFAFEGLVAGSERKAEYVGRLIDAEESGVQAANRMVIDDRQADLGFGDRLGSKYVLDRRAPAPRVGRNDRLLVCRLDLNHVSIVLAARHFTRKSGNPSSLPCEVRSLELAWHRPLGGSLIRILHSAMIHGGQRLRQTVLNRSQLPEIEAALVELTVQ